MSCGIFLYRSPAAYFFMNSDIAHYREKMISLFLFRAIVL